MRSVIVKRRIGEAQSSKKKRMGCAEQESNRAAGTNQSGALTLIHTGCDSSESYIFHLGLELFLFYACARLGLGLAGQG
jgi:hypothetical protein